MCGDFVVDVNARTTIMGIVNVTPDSFSDGGAFVDAGAAVAHAERLLAEGAHIVDVGGESTRPGAAAVAVDDEIARVLPVVAGLAARGVRCISVDTRNARTARAVLDAGAAWINDVSALRHDPAMIDVVTGRDGGRPAQGVVIMHWPVDWTRAAPDARGDKVVYGDVVVDVVAFLRARLGELHAAGVDPSRIVVDPGLGFGKSVEDNVRLLKAGAQLASLGVVLMGPSRKRFVGALAGVDDPKARDAATVGAVACAVFHGAHMVRVHDVGGTVEATRVIDAVRRAR